MTSIGVPALSVPEVLAAQGAGPIRRGARHERLAAIAGEAVALGASVVAPEVAWSWRAVRAVHPAGVQLTGGPVLRHPVLAQALAGASRVAAAVLTLGNELDEVMRREAERRPSLALALDAYGSLLLMRLAGETRTSIATEAAALGLVSGAPLSPGAPGWPVVPGQAEVLSLVAARPAGLGLTSHGMLVPAKSLTFLVGAGVALTPGGEPCDRCDRAARCTHRNSSLTA